MLLSARFRTLTVLVCVVGCGATRAEVKVSAKAGSEAGSADGRAGGASADSSMWAGLGEGGSGPLLADSLPVATGGGSAAAVSVRSANDDFVAIGQGGADGSALPTDASGERVVATMPGFRQFADGRTRVFVQMSGRAKVTESRTKRRLVYRLRGVKVPERVNRMALPTEYFGTPVKRVLLVQAKGGADLVIELRAPSEFKVRLRKAPSGTQLNIDFPKLAVVPLKGR